MNKKPNTKDKKLKNNQIPRKNWSFLRVKKKFLKRLRSQWRMSKLKYKKKNPAKFQLPKHQRRRKIRRQQRSRKVSKNNPSKNPKVTLKISIDITTIN